MADNNPANDRYNPPGNLSRDFEEFKFEELEVEELFWQTSLKTEQNPWRKVSPTTAKNLKSGKTHNFKTKTKVFQRI
jgi:hypothetical protein